MKNIAKSAWGTYFGTSVYLPLGLLHDLETMEKESAIYAWFCDKRNRKHFRSYRIQLTPKELFECVVAYIWKHNYDLYRRSGASIEEALKRIEPRMASRVCRYGSHRGCLASFLGRNLEALLCGNRRNRYQEIRGLA